MEDFWVQLCKHMKEHEKLDLSAIEISNLFITQKAPAWKDLPISELQAINTAGNEKTVQAIRSIMIYANNRTANMLSEKGKKAFQENWDGEFKIGNISKRKTATKKRKSPKSYEDALRLCGMSEEQIEEYKKTRGM